MHKDGLRHIRVHEGPREDVRFELLCKQALHLLIHKLLEQLIEKEEWLPDVDTDLDRSLDQHALLTLEVLRNFHMRLSTSLHLSSHCFPLCNKLINQVCDE